MSESNAKGMRELSRASYHGTSSAENINIGSLQRIADALEKAAEKPSKDFDLVGRVSRLEQENKTIQREMRKILKELLKKVSHEP